MSGLPAPGPAKEELRRLFRRRRREALPLTGEGILATARHHVPALLGRRPGHLGLYWPVGSEPDLRPLAAGWAGPLALPAVADGALHYRPWRLEDPLTADACGIPSPVPRRAGAEENGNLEPGALALLLVPALAIAPCGLRLGAGGGWYDRLRADPRWAAVPALAVLPSACTGAALPRDPWDIPFDGWIDERHCQLTPTGQAKVASS